MNETRYREAERRLWDDVGVTPTEHRLHLARNDVDVRVQEVGEGPPALFVHGGPGAAGAVWASLAARLPHVRCLLLDRPGTGLSDPHHLADAAAVRRESETLVVDVLDALDVERAHLVGSSHGSYVAMLSTAAAPERIDRTVHLGCPGFVDGMEISSLDRLVLAPGARHLLALYKPSERAFRSTFRQLGHEATMAAGKIPQTFVDWSLDLQRYTSTMRNELESMANMGSFRRGFDPSLTIEPRLLEAVGSPSYFLWGDHDPYGDEAVARRLVAAMPSARLEMLPGAGHLCWLDDLDHAADLVHRHLRHSAAIEDRARGGIRTPTPEGTST